MTYSNQSSGVERGTARVRHNRPIKGVLEFPLLRDVHEVWFSDIFSLKIWQVVGSGVFRVVTEMA